MPAFVVPTTFTANDRYSPIVLSMSRTTERFARNTQRFASDTSRLFTRPKNAVDGMLDSMTGGSFNARMIGVFGTGGLIATGLKYIIDAAGEAESATYSFVPSLGSLEKANSLTQELYKEAERTSLSFDGLQTPTKMLMSMGAATEKTIIPTLRTLGDLAMGDSERLGRIAHQYGQIAAKGKLEGTEVRDLSSHIPVLQGLAQYYGKDLKYVMARMKDGNVSFKDVEASFIRMTSKGGMFFNAAAQRMNSLPGQVERLSEYLQGAARELGDAMLPAVKHLVERFGQVVIRTREWATANKELVAQQADKWFERIGNGAIWLYNNFGLITTAAKWYIGALVTLKVISMSVAAYQYAAATATFVMSASMGVSAAMTGVNTRAVVGNNIAKAAYTVTTNAGTAATWAFGWATKMAAIDLAVLTLGATALGAALYYVVSQYGNWNDITQEKSKAGFADSEKFLLEQADVYKKQGMSEKEANDRAIEDTRKRMEAMRASANYEKNTAKTSREKDLAELKMNRVSGWENALQSPEEILKRDKEKRASESVEYIKNQSMINTHIQTTNNQKFSMVLENETPYNVKTKGKHKGLDIKIPSTRNYSENRNY